MVSEKATLSSASLKFGYVEMIRMRYFLPLTLAIIAPAIASGEMLKGAVTDSSGTPISGAMLMVHWDSAGSTVGLKSNVGIKADLIIRTKDDGTFSVDLPPGFYDVFASALPHLLQRVARSA